MNRKELLSMQMVKGERVMDDLISRRALYERAATLEAQALDYVGKLIERDGEETSVEWRIWSAILTERTAFKHDVYDAPSVNAERKRGKWKKWWEVKPDGFGGEVHIPHWACAECGTEYSPHLTSAVHYCVNCGVEMEVEE